MAQNEQLSLNNQLYIACTTEPINYDKIGLLLNAGAQPLGIENVADSGYDGCLYTSIIEHYIDQKPMTDTLYRITQVFLEHGMVISQPPQPYDEDDLLHPLWECAFLGGEELLKVIRLLLENGLDADSAGRCWGHAIFDLIMIADPEEKYWHEFYEETARKIMLFASFDHVLDNDKDLQRLFWCGRNDYPTKEFRNWEKFDFVPGDPGMILIIRKDTREPVWKFSLVIDP